MTCGMSRNLYYKRNGPSYKLKDTGDTQGNRILKKKGGVVFNILFYDIMVM